MTRLLFGLTVAAVVLTVYALVDAALFDRSRIRGLPRGVWIVIVLVLPVIGPALWFVVGRGRRGSQPRGARTVAPDDDLEFLGQLGRDAEQEQRIRKLEQELAELDGGPDRPAITDGHEGGTANDATAEAGGDAQAGPEGGQDTPGISDESGDAPGTPGSRDA